MDEGGVFVVKKYLSHSQEGSKQRDSIPNNSNEERFDFGFLRIYRKKLALSLTENLRLRSGIFSQRSHQIDFQE